jgi:3',5'-cyclic AMP phosphodiesterase CpdA
VCYLYLMSTIRLRTLLFAALLVLLAAACTQSPGPAVPPSPSAEAVPAAELFRFAAYGDTRDGHDVHRKLVEDVLSFHPALVLQTGDLVHHGNAAGEWKTFDDITGDMRRQVAYYPARGNHDVAPEGYYEQRVTQPVLSGNKLYYSFEKESLHFVAIDTQQPLGPESEQGRWLEADLAQAQAAGRFIIPFFHKAIFSIGPHAVEPDVQALKPILHPLFQRYGVRLAFEGHDHVYYRTVRDGITYVVTGGGGAPLYDGQHPELGLPEDVFEKVNHFCIVDIYADRVEVTAYRSDLTKLDGFEVAMARRSAL